MKKKVRYIVVDAGKNTVKFFELLSNGTIKSLNSFPARFKEGSSNTIRTSFEFDTTSTKKGASNPILRNRTFQVTYGHDHYVLGEKGEFYCNFNDKTQPIHRLCAYTAIANTVEDGDDVHLIIGSTYNYTADEEDLEKIKDYYMNDGYINITVDNVEKSFNITGVSVYPEGLAYLLRMKYKTKPISIGCDIGGKTSDVYDFSSGASVYCTSDKKFGINTLYRNLESKLTLYAKNIKPTEQDYIDIIMKKDDLRIPLTDEQLEELNAMIDSFVSKIINFVFKYYEDFDECILFSGGSSIVLKERIINNLTQADIPEENILFAKSPFDNVFSYGLCFLKELHANEKETFKRKVGPNFRQKAKMLEQDYMKDENF